MSSFTGYIAIGSIILGIGLGVVSEECNKWQTVEPVEAIVGVVTWPSYIVSRIFFETEKTEYTCQ